MEMETAERKKASLLRLHIDVQVWAFYSVEEKHEVR
jgi:hypothetical protein